MKRRSDRSHRVRTPALTTLDWVGVRRPTQGQELMLFWSDPLQVTEQLGSATFRLSDGTRWHACRLRKVLLPTAADLESSHIPNPGPAGPDNPTLPGDRPAHGSDQAFSRTIWQTFKICCKVMVQVIMF